jgi:predicted amidohydrolase
LVDFMGRPLPLALVQATARPADDVPSFAAHLQDLTRTHATTRLFVYPELHFFHGRNGESDEELVEATAEPLGGPRDRALAELAGDLGVWLAPGSFYERDEDGRVYNTSVVYSPEGRRIATYRKVFPWRPYEKLVAGSEFVVFDMQGHGRVGLSICYDAWFPEMARHLAWMGAELILNVVKTPTADRAQEVVIARANAIVNQVFVASVNAATPDGLGRSLLVDPQGTVRLEAPGSESMVLSDVIDLDEVDNVRRFGTAGVTTPWQQFTGGDQPLPLPFYSGSINPELWASTLQPREQEK